MLFYSLLKSWNRCLSLEEAAVLKRWSSSRDTVIVQADNDDYTLDRGAYLMEEFLDAWHTLKDVIYRCRLPGDPRLLAPCLIMTDHAFRNILIDPEMLNIKPFLDWDEIFSLPFVLCTRYPEEISWSYSAPPSLRLTGRFDFVPNEDLPLPGEEYLCELERQQHRSFYSARLKFYDERFSPDSRALAYSR